MKKKASAKLRLSRETLRALQARDMKLVAGGFPTSLGICLPQYATQCNCLEP